MTLPATLPSLAVISNGFGMKTTAFSRIIGTFTMCLMTSGKAAGMKGVTVVHQGGVTTSGDESNPGHSGAMQSIEPRISRFRVWC
jgi:hypothetical protein